MPKYTNKKFHAENVKLVKQFGLSGADAVQTVFLLDLSNDQVDTLNETYVSDLQSDLADKEYLQHRQAVFAARLMDLGHTPPELKKLSDDNRVKIFKQLLTSTKDVDHSSEQIAHLFETSSSTVKFGSMIDMMEKTPKASKLSDAKLKERLKALDAIRDSIEERYSGASSGVNYQNSIDKIENLMTAYTLELLDRQKKVDKSSKPREVLDIDEDLLISNPGVIKRIGATLGKSHFGKVVAMAADSLSSDNEREKEGMPKVVEAIVTTHIKEKRLNALNPLDIIQAVEVGALKGVVKMGDKSMPVHQMFRQNAAMFNTKEAISGMMDGMHDKVVLRDCLAETALGINKQKDFNKFLLSFFDGIDKLNAELRNNAQTKEHSQKIESFFADINHIFDHQDIKPMLIKAMDDKNIIKSGNLLIITMIVNNQVLAEKLITELDRRKDYAAIEGLMDQPLYKQAAKSLVNDGKLSVRAFEQIYFNDKLNLSSKENMHISGSLNFRKGYSEAMQKKAAYDIAQFSYKGEPVHREPVHRDVDHVKKIRGEEYKKHGIERVAEVAEKVGKKVAAHAGTAVEKLGKVASHAKKSWADKGSAKSETRERGRVVTGVKL